MLCCWRSQCSFFACSGGGNCGKTDLCPSVCVPCTNTTDRGQVMDLTSCCMHVPRELVSTTAKPVAGTLTFLCSTVISNSPKWLVAQDVLVPGAHENFFVIFALDLVSDMTTTGLLVSAQHHQKQSLIFPPHVPCHHPRRFEFKNVVACEKKTDV